jgi:hypothetical protein
MKARSPHGEIAPRTHPSKKTQVRAISSGGLP